MKVRTALGVLMLGHAAIVAFQLVLSFSDLQESAAAFAAPDDPSRVMAMLVAINLLIAFSAAVLGTYLIRAGEPRLMVVVPLAIAAAMFGSYALVLGVVAIGVCLVERYRSK
ncbi:hypothetical protein E4656_00060 [Natronospirillum operosum]|uniref:DUF4064 domain-containing protein n=1 Tax=Natronospirillum operosum TaxID=2759953 RepID=A0A4Z0W9N8_9GAMM|nr:hypothetical protein [Natronospirillum operosum]TGG94862.1 hypothetical protein E4656_00060 [Natronospirillum operosum]